VSDTQARLAHERDYIARTIETVRNHKDADNCWPQWANIFADQIESLEAELERVTAAAASVEKTLDDYLRLGISPSREMWYAARDSLRAALTGGARAAQEDK
jgi:hypothetical protein